MGWPTASFRSPIKFFFGDLPRSLAGSLLTLAGLGWLSVMTAFPSIARGGPAGSADGCAYRLSSHGTFSCVSRQTFDQTGAGEQRFAAGILLAFFCLHTGAALGHIRSRRPAGPAGVPHTGPTGFAAGRELSHADAASPARSWFRSVPLRWPARPAGCLHRIALVSDLVVAVVTLPIGTIDAACTSVDPLRASPAHLDGRELLH